jgi:hypothetical protein
MVLRWVIASVIAATVWGGFGGLVLAAPPAHGTPGYLQPCSDKDKLAVDPATGAGLVLYRQSLESSALGPRRNPYHRNTMSIGGRRVDIR